MRTPRLLGVGGAHIDRRGQVFGIYVPGASNPGTMREEVGGVAFNALRMASRRGAACGLVSIRGGDSGGEHVAREIAEARIDDHSAVFLDRATASYTALIDRDGELIAGFADMGIYDLFSRQLRRSAFRNAVATSDAVLCDANLSEKALRTVVDAADGKPVYAIGISPAKVIRLAGVLDRLDCLFMNRKEAFALLGSGGGGNMLPIRALTATGLRGAVITNGDAELTVFDRAGCWTIRPPVPRRIADVTGAGDALAGATVAALVRGVDLSHAAREGVAAAMLALETPLAVPTFSAADFDEALSLVPGAVAVA